MEVLGAVFEGDFMVLTDKEKLDRLEQVLKGIEEKEYFDSFKNSTNPKELIETEITLLKARIGQTPPDDGLGGL